MLTNKEKEEIVEDIINSSVFSKAPKSQSLLRFLFRAHLSGDPIKEEIIDQEFFGTQNSRDTNRVRVNIYYLRKKINSYYEKEGKALTWRICIDKGQYALRFEKLHSHTLTNMNMGWREGIIGVLSLIIILLVLVNFRPKKTSFLWEDFMSNNQTRLVLGDLYGMDTQTPMGTDGWIRDFTINDSKDYLELLQTKPELQNRLRPSSYTHINFSGAFATQKLSKFFSEYHCSFELYRETEMSMEELKNNDVIYIGASISRERIMNLYNFGNPYSVLSNQSIRFTNMEEQKDTIFQIASSGVHYEYAIVSRFELNKHHYFLFLSTHEMGNKAMVGHFTNNDSIQSFLEFNNIKSPNFTTLYKLSGQDRTSLRTEKVWTTNW